MSATILARLENEHILSIERVPGERFRFREECDGYFFEDLTRDELLVLAQELTALADGQSGDAK